MRTFTVGQVLVWKRYDERLTCTVLEIRPHNSAGYQRASLRIEGWASTTWEYLDHAFLTLAEAEAEEREERSRKEAVRNFRKAA